MTSRGGFYVGGSDPTGANAPGRWDRNGVYEAIIDQTWPGLSVFGVDSLMYLLDLADPNEGGYVNRTLTVGGQIIETEYRSYTGGLTFAASGALGSGTADTKLTCVRIDGDLTIDAAATITPTVRKKGLVIYVRGNATIDGTLSMTARGAQAQIGQDLLVMTDYTIPAQSNATPTFTPSTAYWNGGNRAGYLAGSIRSLPGRNGATGSGGGGGADNNVNTSSTLGIGALGNSWSGGAGEGGGGRAGGGSAPAVNGGSGGSGSPGDNINGNLGGGGGAGNPGGAAGASPGAGLNAGATAGSSGTGGLLIFVVTGNIAGSGSFTSDGSAGGDGARGNGSTSNHSGGGGGGSGGGSVNVFYGGASTFTGTVRAKGGAGGKRSYNTGSTYGYSAHDGAPGSDGTEHFAKLYRGVSDAVFSYTGAEQTILVPSGVTQATIECWGAQGGETHAWSTQNAGAGINKHGGKGGYVKGTITVTPGETLRINVGQKGGWASAWYAGAAAMTPSWPLGTGVGGWNGGGSGGSLVAGGAGNGAGGGGATDIRQGGTTLANRVLVAAGGGGATGANPGSGTANPLGPGGSGALGAGGSGGNGRSAGGGGGGGYYGGGGGAGSDYTGIGDPFDGGDGGGASGADGGGTAGGYPGTQVGGGGSGHSKGGTTSGGGGGGSNYVGSATAPQTLRGLREGHGLSRITWVRS